MVIYIFYFILFFFPSIRAVAPPPESPFFPTQRVLMNEEIQPDPSNPHRQWIEMIEFEIDYEKGTWKRIRKRRGIKVRSAGGVRGASNGVAAAQLNGAAQPGTNGVVNGIH